MITASGLELRAGARILIESASFRIAKGDRIGLVGRNGAGKTTLTKVLAGEGMPAAGTVTRSGDVGYLPQDPRTGDLDVLARDRILSARDLDSVLRKMRENEDRMANGKGATRDKAMKKYERLETEFLTKGGYAAEAEAATIAASLGLPDRILGQPLHTLSGGQRRRVELARILFSDSDTLLLDEPTNHLDADSIVWLRDYLKTYRGGFIVISHDVDLVETVVNKVFYLDANRSNIDIYNMGWKLYQQQREADEKRRKRERQNAEKKAAALNSQADKMRAKATKTVAAQNMAKRADKLLAGLEAVRASDKVAKLRFPDPAPCGKTPLTAEGLSKSYGSLEIFTDVDLAIDKGSRVVILGLNGAGKTTLLRALLGLTPRARATLRLGDTDVTTLPPHRRGVAWVPQDSALFPHLSALSNTAYGLRAQGTGRAEARRAAQLWLDRLGVGPLAHRKPAQLSGGQAQRVALARALAARPRLLLLDEPLAALDQTTRAHVRHTLRGHLAGFGGVCLMVTHDPVEAVSLADRVLVLDDGHALQDAPPAEVTRHPRSPWVARMLGRNAWPGTATGDGLALTGGGHLVAADRPPDGARALAIIAPEAVSLHLDKPTGSPRNVWPGTVREITSAGSRLRILVTSDEAPDLVAEITPSAALELGLADGVSVWTSVKATEVSLVTL